MLEITTIFVETFHGTSLQNDGNLHGTSLQNDGNRANRAQHCATGSMERLYYKTIGYPCGAQRRA